MRDAGAEDNEYRTILRTIQKGFREHKRDIEETIGEYWNVSEHPSLSDDGFILHEVRLVIPSTLRTQVSSDLHSGHRGIEGTKARA